MKYGLYSAGEREAWTVELRDRIERWAPPPWGGGLTARGGKADREPRQGEGSSETISRVAFANFFFVVLSSKFTV